jgi:hypothetical protein
MEAADVRQRFEHALQRLQESDRYLLENDLSERCIAARLAMYLQPEFPDHNVDVEYNRFGDRVKRLPLPPECVRRLNRAGDPPAVLDAIVHRRGPDGPNILVLELKKTSNPAPRDCDRIRVHAFRAQLEYEFGTLIECETRDEHVPAVRISKWIDDRQS